MKQSERRWKQIPMFLCRKSRDLAALIAVKFQLIYDLVFRFGTSFSFYPWMRFGTQCIVNSSWNCCSTFWRQAICGSLFAVETAQAFISTRFVTGSALSKICNFWFVIGHSFSLTLKAIRIFIIVSSFQLANCTWHAHFRFQVPRWTLHSRDIHVSKLGIEVTQTSSHYEQFHDLTVSQLDPGKACRYVQLFSFTVIGHLIWSLGWG